MTFLYCYMAAVFIVLFLAACMECQALKNGISGANGFVWVMLSMVMCAALFPVTLLAWIFEDSRTAFATFVCGAGWLALVFTLSKKMILATERQK